ncbi:stalk domain-containing protein [Natranaerobius trueperi]|uniref:Copper amine oxidase-like N-terminal domain-containing protein n=1 Tax=Natranaerobius trueperi TaxID=759412 RepID=A0A226BZ62_9FIRM|nr:stalk domain-containing protein [Natranaerobius trueperi]OWZ83397.1 hypothetical protein CDO51_08845 [Natranaerobius trueperi]
MRKSLKLIIISCLLLLSTSFVLAEENLDIYIDNELVELEKDPYIDKNGRALVPLRFISEELGGL